MMSTSKGKIKLSFDENDHNRSEPIRWINIIFLPFHPTWKLIVLASVLLKCSIGPLASVYGINCSEIVNNNAYLTTIRLCYNYAADFVYVVDTFLFIIHRQVKDEAMRREHLPKHAFLLLLDLIACIPFFSLLSNANCPPVQLYPNILALTEVLIVYRVVQYFSLPMSHSTLKLLMGYLILLLLYINVLTCVLLLLTAEGLCPNCLRGVYDWRYSIITKLVRNNSSMVYKTHLYASALVSAITVHRLVDQTRPATYIEFASCILLMILGYLFTIFLVMPKFFAEGILRMRRISSFHPQVTRIINETKRRNPNPTAYQTVEKFYSLIWTKRSGITSMPQVIEDLPHYLKLNIKQDLMWPVIHHSPTFRKTSFAFKRWLCSRIDLHYKLPGENLYDGPHCYSNLYYIKTGIIQLVSFEDNVSALLSVTSGSIFGDISFYIPPLHRNVTLKCLTYCEVFYISRAFVLKSMHLFPDDRQIILESAKKRIKHARTLHNCKNNIKGFDRKEDEGIAWVKKRWWEINNSIENWKKVTTKEHKLCKISLEEANYHCPKFLGQLVLSTAVQLKRKSMFARIRFPWILAPYSPFGDVWHQIVFVTVFLVLIALPPIIVNSNNNPTSLKYLIYFQRFTDLVFVLDIFVSIVTAVEKDGTILTSVASIFFERCKSIFFILDLLATPWIEYFVLVLDAPHYYYVVQFNRLLKVYVIFKNTYKKVWTQHTDPFYHTTYKMGLIHFVNAYVLGYLLFMIIQFNPKLTHFYFFGETCRAKEKEARNECHYSHVLTLIKGWLFEILYPEHQPETIADVVTALMTVFLFFFINMYTRTRLMAAFYLKFRQIMNYYFFVSNVRTHFIRNNIHPNLLLRLERHLNCHWKFYHGMDILYPNQLKGVPYDIYRKIHGEVAESIIGNSKVFFGANPAMVKEMSHKAKFLIVPDQCTFIAFGVHAKNVIWVVKGSVRCDSYDEDGNVVTDYCSSGASISMATILLRKASLQTYIAATDCEILYIQINDFFAIINHYPNEKQYFETVQTEMFPLFHQFYRDYVKKNRTLLKKLRETIFNMPHGLMAYFDKKSKTKRRLARIKKNFHLFVEFRQQPESRLIRIWLSIRAVVVILAIVSAALEGGCGAVIRPSLHKFNVICDSIGLVDIVIKLFLPYYDERGLIISKARKCATHYLARGFLLDLIGSLPWSFILEEVFREESQNTIQLLHALCEFSHLYILTGYFNYWADMPTANFVLLMLVKWQIVTVLILLGVSNFLVGRCIELHWDENFNLVQMERLNSCWLPNYLNLNEEPTVQQLNLVFAESLGLAQCGFLFINLGKFHVEEGQFTMTLFFMGSGVIFWYIMTSCKTLLILHYRGNTIFAHGLFQLKKFLEAERVDKKVVSRAVNHFIYVWQRTKGINVQTVMNERIGAVFRQDMAYFFFKRTLYAADSLLNGGEPLERMLASNIYIIHFLPEEDIVRENELSHSLYILHRGKVVVYKEGEKQATLTKGAMFGQLEGTNARPLRITARADDYVDLLHLTLKQFQEIITDDVRETIAENPESQFDYMSIKTNILESPYNTIQYIMFQDLKTIKLPFMEKAVSPDDSAWYSRWLFLVWLCGPMFTAVLVLLAEAMPEVNVRWVFLLNLGLDILHVVNLVSELFTMEVVVDGNQCVQKYIRSKKLLKWRFYLDTVSVLVPWVGLAAKLTHHWQLVKLLRIHNVNLYQQQFCQSFQSSLTSLLVKFLLVLLTLHALACGWILIACKNKDFTDGTVKVPNMPENPSTITDTTEWVYQDTRNQGCVRCLKIYREGTIQTGFLVPRVWYADYLVALCYIVIIQTHTNMDSIVPLTVSEMYYRTFMTFVLFLIEMYITSVCISIVYTKLREVYHYDYHVSYSIKYLKDNGVSRILLETIVKYTRLLWQRQRGNWLPELTKHAPDCLREDILSALYMHHLESTPLLQNLPGYFLRQLVARMKRIVVFPGNYLINQGDIHPCMYFIHDGEVEKWQNDSSGNFRMASFLTGNVCFGLIPGLFPYIPYKFAYFTRTVVDLVYLRYEDWQDLLDCYPDLKQDLYEAAMKYKKNTY